MATVKKIMFVINKNEQHYKKLTTKSMWRIIKKKSYIFKIRQIRIANKVGFLILGRYDKLVEKNH